MRSILNAQYYWRVLRSMFIAPENLFNNYQSTVFVSERISQLCYLNLIVEIAVTVLMQLNAFKINP